jgi:rSAM/selenodomain-associated transferase 2
VTICIVIPALNEERMIVDTLASVGRQPGAVEVIVVDGGSDDATVAAAERGGARVIRSERGRATQMNAGAAASTADILLFLHADTRLPAGATQQVRAALEDPSVSGGCFRLRFDRSTAVYRFYTSRLWMRWTRLAFGDRAIFCRRSAFDAAGGFPAQPIFEDLDFVARLALTGRFAFLPEHVTTSARRFAANGPVRQQLRNAALWAAWLAGVPAATLARFYGYD